MSAQILGPERRPTLLPNSKTRGRAHSAKISAQDVDRLWPLLWGEAGRIRRRCGRSTRFGRCPCPMFATRIAGSSNLGVGLGRLGHSTCLAHRSWRVRRRCAHGTSERGVSRTCASCGRQRDPRSPWRPTFRFRGDFGRNWAHISRIRPNLGHTRPNLGQLQRTSAQLVQIGQIRAGVDRISSKVRPQMARVSRIWPKFGEIWPDLGHHVSRID